MKRLFIRSWGWPMGSLLHYLGGVPPPPEPGRGVPLDGLPRLEVDLHREHSD